MYTVEQFFSLLTKNNRLQEKAQYSKRFELHLFIFSIMLQAQLSALLYGLLNGSILIVTKSCTKTTFCLNNILHTPTDLKNQGA